MKNYYKLLAPNGRVTNEAVRALVLGRYEESMDFHRSLFRMTTQWSDLYNGVTTGQISPSRHNIALPMLMAFMWSDVAYKTQTSFGSWPIVSFHGAAPEDAPIAAANEALISQQMKDARSFEKAVDFFAGADLYGTQWIRYGWTHTEYKRRMRIKTRGGVGIVDMPVVEFDGPDWDNLDILDVLPQPGKKRFKDCAWAVIRYWMDLDDIKAAQAMAKASGEEPMFDQDAVDELERGVMSQITEDELKLRQQTSRYGSTSDAMGDKRFDKPVEMLEMWGTVPEEFAVKGDRKVVITIGNRNSVLRYHENPYWHGQIPLGIYTPMPDHNNLHGKSKIEVTSKMAAAMNKLINIKLDAMELFVSPPLLVSDSFIPTSERMISRPGQLIRIPGLNIVDDKNIRPMPVDLRGLQMAFTEVEQLSRYIQQGMGISESTIAGFDAASRATARESLIKREASLTRIMLESRIAEEAWLEPLANMFRRLNRQFLTLPMSRNIMGSLSQKDPITGLPLPESRVEIGLEHLNADYEARAVGATQLMSKSMRLQSMLAIQQQLQANPVGLQITNWVNFFRDVFKSADLEPAQLLVTDIPQVNANAAQMQLPQQGGMQQEGGTSLPQLEPNVLGGQNTGQMMNIGGGDFGGFGS